MGFWWVLELHLLLLKLSARGVYFGKIWYVCIYESERYTLRVALKLCSRPYAAPLQHHGPLSPWMGDWAEWVQWADWVNAIAQTQVHFTSSFKDLQLKNRKSTLFSLVRDQCGTEKELFCATLVAPNGKKVLFNFSTWWKVSNEEVKCTCVCVIASTQSAHCTHSAQSPIFGEVGRGAAVAPRTADITQERYVLSYFLVCQQAAGRNRKWFSSDSAPPTGPRNFSRQTAFRSRHFSARLAFAQWPHSVSALLLGRTLSERIPDISQRIFFPLIY